jgi:hypothetical protein
MRKMDAGLGICNGAGISVAKHYTDIQLGATSSLRLVIAVTHAHRFTHCFTQLNFEMPLEE